MGGTLGLGTRLLEARPWRLLTRASATCLAKSRPALWIDKCHCEKTGASSAGKKLATQETCTHRRKALERLDGAESTMVEQAGRDSSWTILTTVKKPSVQACTLRTGCQVGKVAVFGVLWFYQIVTKARGRSRRRTGLCPWAKAVLVGACPGRMTRWRNLVGRIADRSVTRGYCPRPSPSWFDIWRWVEPPASAALPNRRASSFHTKRQRNFDRLLDGPGNHHGNHRGNNPADSTARSTFRNSAGSPAGSPAGSMIGNTVFRQRRRHRGR